MKNNNTEKKVINIDKLNLEDTEIHIKNIQEALDHDDGVSYLNLNIALGKLKSHRAILKNEKREIVYCEICTCELDLLYDYGIFKDEKTKKYKCCSCAIKDFMGFR